MKQSSFQGKLIRGSFCNTFAAGSSGRKRINSLVLGAASALLLFAGEPRVGAQYSILHSFGSVAEDGAYPETGMIRAPDGKFYGVTSAQAGRTGAGGTVFQITPAGALRVIKRFGTGQALNAPLLYHKKRLIGLVGNSVTKPNGALFAVTGYPDGPWDKDFWHNFGATADDGIDPVGGVILGSDGDLYGTTNLGGSAGFGTIYKVNPKSHKLTVVYSFTSTYGAGIFPGTALLQDKNGNFYGGAEGVFGGDIFEMTPDGQVAPFSEFCCNVFLTGPLIQGSDGNFYGTAGGPIEATSPDSVFQLTPTGESRLLYTFFFLYGVTSGVIQGRDGNLYGLINSGGTAGKGFVFQLSTDGSSFNVLHNFGDGTVQNDGEYPSGTLVVGSDNNLYGTTNQGGSAGLGTVFSISP